MKYSKIASLVLVGALGLTTMAAHDAQTQTREANCDAEEGEFIEGTHPQSESSARNRDRCVVTTTDLVEDGEPKKTGESDPYPVGDPVLVSRTVTPLPVNRGGVVHGDIEELHSQPMEVEIFWEQSMKLETTVTTWEFHPNQNSLQAPVPAVSSVPADAEPLDSTTEEAEAAGPSTSTSKCVVSNRGKGGNCPAEYPAA